MWFCHYHRSQGTWCGVLLALPLCHSSSLSPRCLVRLIQIMPWVLLRWIFFSELILTPIYLGWCSLWFMLSVSGVDVATIVTSVGSIVGVCTTATFFSIPMVSICASWCLTEAHNRGALSSYFLHYFKLGVASCFSNSSPPAIPLWWNLQLSWLSRGA